MPSDLIISDLGIALALERGFVCIEGDTLAVPLRRKGRMRPTTWTLISREDRRLADYFWSLDKLGYPRRRDKTGAGIRISREIMGLTPADHVYVDHINRDKFDNRRENLRIVTHKQNCQNVPSRKGSSSQYRGVSRRGDKWQAYGTLNRKMTNLGTFDTEEAAAVASLQWRRENMPWSVD